MKTKWMQIGMAALIFSMGAVAAWSQITTGRVSGQITDGGKPIPNANIVLTNVDNGHSYKAKTDQNGHFEAIGVASGVYNEDVSDANGKKIGTNKVQVRNQSGVMDDLSMDVSKFGPAMSNEEYAKKKEEHDKAVNENTLIAQLNPALQSKNWAAAEPLLQQLIAINPKRWEYEQVLGNAQLGEEKFDDAIATYEKTIPLAEDSLKTDPKADPAKTKAAIAQIYNSEGNAYTKLKKNDKAVEAYTKAAEMDPNPGAAYFNLCATQYNSGNTQGAVAACDKAIAADPNRADAYFIKGSLMMGESKQAKDGKLEAPEGTADALNKYLQLAPDGPHAGDVKQMLTYIGAKIDTTYKDPNAKKKK